MSKPERGSLTTLLTKKPLGQGAPAAVPLEQAESAVLRRDEAAVPEGVQPNVRTSIPTNSWAEPPMTSAAPAGTTPESERYVPTDVRTTVQTDGQPTKLLNRNRSRTVRVPWTFKMPFELRAELEAVARFNDLNMTEIAVEAIERHLKHFPHPPGQHGGAGG